MARSSRLHVLRTVLTTGLVPLFHHDDVDVACDIVKAVADGGARAVEFTNRGDRAHEVFSELQRFCRRELPDVLLGAGTVGEPATAALYVNLGADFVVAHVLNADVATVCNRRKVAYIPGCATMSEIAAAEELGCEIVKLFPGDAAGGPEFVSAVLGPSPWTRIMPTGGVDTSEASLRAWFDAGAAAVGIGSKLIGADVVADHDWAGLRDRVRRTLDTIATLNERVRASL